MSTLKVTSRDVLENGWIECAVRTQDRGCRAQYIWPSNVESTRYADDDVGHGGDVVDVNVCTPDIMASVICQCIFVWNNVNM